MYPAAEGEPPPVPAAAWAAWIFAASAALCCWSVVDVRELLALDRRQLLEILLPLDLSRDHPTPGGRQPVAQRANLTYAHGDDSRFLAMPLARRPRLLALAAHPGLHRADLVRDAFVLVGDPLQVVEHVERVREARRREQQRQRVGLLLAVELVDAIPEAAHRDRMLPPQELQTLGLQPEELVQAAQALAAKLELVLERLELDRDVVDALGERADLARRGLHLRAEGRLPALRGRDPGSERRDPRVDGLLSLFDRVRAGRGNRDHCQHEDESRTADHAARFAGRRASPPSGYSRAFIARAASARSGATSAR